MIPNVPKKKEEKKKKRAFRRKNQGGRTLVKEGVIRYCNGGAPEREKKKGEIEREAQARCRLQGGGGEGKGPLPKNPPPQKLRSNYCGRKTRGEKGGRSCLKGKGKKGNNGY